MKLSIIDQAPVPSGMSTADALRHSISLAEAAERWGYHRYWVAEHHDFPSLASPAPEVLIARLGASTRTLRLGSGGIMLPHYSALKVAEVFRMLHALYPDRIDLGIGRAPGGGPLASLALRRERTRGAIPDDFTDQLVELIAFLHKGFPRDHVFSRIHVTPDMPGAPQLWLLGSSPWSAQAAAEYGLPYAFAHFINSDVAAAAVKHYRSAFRPSALQKEPQVILAVSAICAESAREAERLTASIRALRQRLRSGAPTVILPLDVALAELDGTSPEPATASRPELPIFFGSPKTLARDLLDLAESWQVDELMVVTITHDLDARLRSYQLLAEAFEIKPSSFKHSGAGAPAPRS